jgi:hypothetical protein
MSEFGKLQELAQTDDDEPHGLEDATWNAVADGWQISCLCGWVSGSSKKVEWIGREFDDHMREVVKSPAQCSTCGRLPDYRFGCIQYTCSDCGRKCSLNAITIPDRPEAM